MTFITVAIDLAAILGAEADLRDNCEWHTEQPWRLIVAVFLQGIFKEKLVLLALRPALAGFIITVGSLVFLATTRIGGAVVSGII